MHKKTKISVTEAAEIIEKNTKKPISIVQVRRLCAMGEANGGLRAEKLNGWTWLIEYESAAKHKRLKPGPKSK